MDITTIPLTLRLQAAAIALIVALVGMLVYRTRRSKSKHAGYRFPPGPKPLPLIGNVLDLPPKGEAEFLHWLKHKDIYGPISSVTIMGLTLVIFHDKEAAHAVMGKKAQKTSARPQLNFARLCGFENFLITHQYDDKYRMHRRMVHQEIGTRSLSASFHAVQEKESVHFILQTLHDPDKILQHLKRLAASIILQITYGYSVERQTADPLVDVIEHAMENLSRAFVPLSWAVDAVPALRHLPDWFPGTGYRQTAREWKATNEAAAALPYNFVRRQMALGSHRPSYTSSLLDKENMGPDYETEEAIKWTAASLYAAGSDSTVAIITSVMLALVMFPEVQDRAQEEIDRVVGSTNRLPSFADREHMPYVGGIVKEAWRWNPVGPMGLAHKAEEDIVCGEYLIPAGAYLLPSLWWFLHDPATYSDPGTFKPERYLAPLNEPDPSEIAFGYGRRSCAGRFFADASVYICLVHLLAVFRLRKRRDDRSGDEIPVKLEPIPGMVNRPKEFEFVVEPRSERHVRLLKSIEEKMEPEVSDAGLLNLGSVV